MKNENSLDQFFLIDEAVIKELVTTASISKKERVLEIGAGSGMVTKEVAKKAGKVLAIEIDERFKDELKKLPKNVEVIFGDALEILEKKPKFKKIIGSLPSSLVEPLMQRLVRFNFEALVFLVPLKFVGNLTDEVVFTAYLETQLIRKIEKTAFKPQPKTNWALVKITKKMNPLLAKDYERFIQQYLLQHQEAKLKNALMESVIKIFHSQGKNLTKNQAREIIGKAEISEAQENLVKSEDILKISQLISSVL